MAKNRWRDDEQRRWDEDRNRPGGTRYSQGGGYGQGQYGRDQDRYGRMGQGDYDRSFAESGGYGSDQDFSRRDYASGGYGGQSQGLGQRYGGGQGGGGYGQGGYGGERQSGGERSMWERSRDEIGSWFGDDEARRRRQMDEARGEHRGRGPRGYTRSDERIREDVNDRLSDDPMLDASNIDVKVESCEVTLSGTVSSRSDKRRAEDLIEHCSGVKHVQNNLRVEETGSATGSAGAGMAGTSTQTGGARSNT